MQIHLSRDGEILGTYSLERLRQMADGDELQPDDCAWQEGLPEWLPVKELLAREEAAAADDPLPKPIASARSAKTDSPPAPSAPPVNPPPAPPSVTVSERPAGMPDLPVPRSTKLRPPGSVLPSATPPVKKSSAKLPDPSPATSVEKAIPQSSLRSPDKIGKDALAPKPAAIGASPIVRVRKKPVRDIQVSSLRAIGLPLFVLMLYALFIPFLRMEDANGELLGDKVSAAQLALQEEGSSDLLGIEQSKGIPQFGRLFMVSALLGSLLLSLYLLRSAFKPLGVISTNGIFLCLAVIGVTSLLGLVYGSRLEQSAVKEIEGIRLQMDLGYYIALSVGVFGLALVVGPDYAQAKKLLPLFVPVFVLIAGGVALIWYGIHVTGTSLPSAAEAIDSAKLFYSELTSG